MPIWLRKLAVLANENWLEYSPDLSTIHLVITFYLTITINTSIVTGTYPSIRIYPLVTPLLKTGDVNDPNNFRPVSVLPLSEKILEKMLQSN